MSTKTKHYQLNQYEPGDNFLRTDFNEDNAKIDAALGEKLELVCGTYVGNGVYPRIIHLGFQPRLVYIQSQDGGTGGSSNDYTNGGFITPEISLYKNNFTFANITEDGFSVNRSNLNGTNAVHHYFALR